jgi:hypothetical protein
MTYSLRITNVLRLTMFAAVVISPIYAGCGDTRALQAPFTFTEPRLLTLGANPDVRPVPAPDASSAEQGPSIVGMWNITFTAQGNSAHNPPIPDGAMIDFGYSVWHSDGTEFLNSGMRAPATQNFCLGVWSRTGYNTYQLNHFALSYDQTAGTLNGKVQIQESVTLSADGNSYAGTFTIDVYDPTGTTKVDHLQGTVSAQRVTVSSTFSH